FVQAVPVSNVAIHGNGMTLTGVGQRFIEVEAWHVLVEDLTLDNASGGFVDYPASLDTGTFESYFVRIKTIGPAGIALEGTEGCGAFDCEFTGRGVVAHGYLVNDSVLPVLEDCDSYGAQRGIIAASLGGGSDGNHGLIVRGGAHIGFSLIGIDA